MYCKNCGNQIENDSKFCSHCGFKQSEGEPSLKESIENEIIKTEITEHVVEDHKSSMDFLFQKKTMGWYFAWVLLNVGLLLIASDNILGKHGCYVYYGYNSYFASNDNFWPFSEKGVVQNYDIREFLVYTIFPLATLFIWSMVKSQKNGQKKILEEKKE